MRKVIGILLLVLFLGGCANSEPEIVFHGKPLTFNPSLAASLQEQVKKLERVQDCVVAVYDQKVSAAVEVRGLDRLHLKAVRQEVHQFLTKAMGEDYDIYVTTDKKLYRSLQELTGGKLEDLEPSEALKLKQSLEKLNKDMQG